METSDTDSLLADGLGSGLSEKLAGYAIKCLAVAGGFLIGYFLGKVVAWALDRWVLANKSPDQLKKGDPHQQRHRDRHVRDPNRMQHQR